LKKWRDTRERREKRTRSKKRGTFELLKKLFPATARREGKKTKRQKGLSSAAEKEGLVAIGNKKKEKKVNA